MYGNLSENKKKRKDVMVFKAIKIFHKIRKKKKRKKNKKIKKKKKKKKNGISIEKKYENDSISVTGV